MSDNPFEPTDQWLRDINDRLRHYGVPPAARPIKALSEYSIGIRKSIRFDSPIAVRIFEWFKANSQPGSHAIGALFTGSFFYDACFWPVTIPITYGTVRLNPLNSMETMPSTVKTSLWNDGLARGVCLQYWLDCLDYGFGLNELGNGKILESSTSEFIRNADSDLKGAISQLLFHRPNFKAIFNFRMATEIFLKAFLIQERKLSEKGLKKLGHDISALADECGSVKPLKEFHFVSSQAHSFPEISERYDGAERRLSEVFDVVMLTQITAATVIRHFSGRDTRPQMVEIAMMGQS